ncbi:MAG: tetratricopeptide (TPR) repeat protein [Parvicellaceae bacterium]|jgi:tetratricopeptide (TPR) repeat protein
MLIFFSLASIKTIIIRLFLCFICIFSSLFCTQVLAQFGDKGFFLIDSVDYDFLSDVDKTLLDSVLPKYHSADHDTSRLKLLSELANGLNDGLLWPKYNQFMYDKTNELQQNKFDGKSWTRVISFRSEAINNFGFIQYNIGNRDKALEYFEKSNKMQKDIGYLKGYAHSLNNLGTVYRNLNLLDSALSKYQESYKIDMQLKDTNAAGQSINNIGELYQAKGKLAIALSYYEQGRMMSELARDQERMAQSYGYIGELYATQKNYAKAKVFYLLGLKTNQVIGSSAGIANSYNKLGSICLKELDLDKGLTYFLKAIDGYKSLHFNRGLSGAYSNMSNIYSLKGNSIKALLFSRKGLAIKLNMKDREGTSAAYSDLSGIHLKLGHKDSSLIYAHKARKIAYEINQFQIIKDSEWALYEASKANGMDRVALHAYERYTAYSDSIDNKENQNALIEMQYKYDYGKRAYSDSILINNERILEKQIVAEHKLEAEQRKSDNYLLLGIVAAIAALAIGVFIAFVNKRKSGIEISKKHEELGIQKDLVDSKNDQIIDSINYAERIQNALLKNEDIIKYQLADHFIFYKPKDIVSGDFYWTYERDEYLYVCVADCTGHGVPGAFMSMLGIAFLQETLTSHKLLSPHDILNKLRERIISELSQTGNLHEPMDGMDASILRLNKTTKDLEWCGANNSLFIVSSQNYSSSFNEGEYRIMHNEKDRVNLIELLSQRQPVGFHKNSVPFYSRKLNIADGDQLYLFTDGFSDQFGGERKKKYKLSQLKNLILENYALPLAKQQELLENEHKTWKGDLDQLDDICIIGLKL